MSIQRPVIDIGYRIGMLTAAERTEKRKSGYTVWLCRCDCGGTIELDTRCLQRGSVTDCGCRKKVKPGTSDLSGKRFGKLIALEQTDERAFGGTVVWKCRCDCGKMCNVSVHQLQAGYVKSCGCLSHPPLKDYVGKRFGKLTVTEYAGKTAGMHRWKCVCDCGNETVVGQTLLQSGKTQSCGCMQATSRQRNPFIVDGTNISIIEHYKTHRSPNNTSGQTGVYMDKKNGKWIAQIGFRGKNYYLGSFSDFKDAVAARKRGEEMHDDFLEWYYRELSDKQGNEGKQTKTVGKNE